MPDECPRPRFSLLTSHGRVLLYFAEHPEASMREAACALELSPRTVARTMNDLRDDGRIAVVLCEGRRTHVALAPLASGTVTR